VFKTSFLLPTIRDRFKTVVYTWDYPQAEFLVSYDTQEQNLKRFSARERRALQGTMLEFEHNCSELGGNVAVWNNLAAKATGDAIFVIADDIFNKTCNWQDIVLSRIPNFLSEPWAVVGDDLLRLEGSTTWNRGLAGHPLMSRHYYDLFGYVWYPGYPSQYCDNEFYEVGNAIGRLVYIPEFVYENCHPLAGKARRDRWNGLASKTLGQGYKVWQEKGRIQEVIDDTKRKIQQRYP
jgi:hypothetical protein